MVQSENRLVGIEKQYLCFQPSTHPPSLSKLSRWYRYFTTSDGTGRVGNGMAGWPNRRD